MAPHVLVDWTAHYGHGCIHYMCDGFGQFEQKKYEGQLFDVVLQRVSTRYKVRFQSRNERFNADYGACKTLW